MCETLFLNTPLGSSMIVSMHLCLSKSILIFIASLAGAGLKTFGLTTPQGVRIFGEILRWFERQNDWWPGWVSFLLLFMTAVTLFLPGVALILGAGFVFGYARPPLHAIIYFS